MLDMINYFQYEFNLMKYSHMPKNIFMFYVYTKAPGDRPLHFSKNK